ncbi:MAG: hypothetical protein E6K68_09095 [Nitrospirae bacterium]|nr:MAG: hypothetical protein E6K68_09095 [Nitrospirota bacterium]
MRTPLQPLQAQTGVILVTTLLLLILLTGLALSSLATLGVTQSQSQNLLTTKQAFHLADAGVQYAKKYLNHHQGLWSMFASPTPQTLIPATTLTGLGTFTVNAQDGGNGSLRITSTGTASNNAQAVISSLIVLGPYVPEDAVTVDQSLTISGNATIAGANGGVHTNGDLTITSSPSISTNATAYFSYSATGNPQVTGVAGGDQTVASIPLIKAYSFYGSYDYRLAWDGNVYDQAGIAQPLTGGTWNCWSFSSTYASQTWTLSCNPTVNGTLYFQTNVSIPVSVGTTQSPWITTIIAEGNIDITASSLVARAPIPADGALFKSATQNFLFIADQDFRIGSLTGGNLTGVVAAYEQVSIEGNPTMYGYVVAQNGASGSGLVTTDSISGNLSLTYNGEMPITNILKTAQIQTWMTP